MELPRSRRVAHSPLGRTTESTLLHTAVIDEKKFRVPVLLAFVFIFALLGSLLYYNLFSLVCENEVDQLHTKPFTVDPSTQTSRRDQVDRTLSAANEVRGGETIEADNTLGGLLPHIEEFEDDCASRAHQPHRKINFKPSKKLIQRLREYEDRHRQCARGAQSFFESNNGSQFQESHGDDCRYVVWIAYSGMGNRLMTLVSAFLYALLTNRTLLVDRSTDLSELFCEPIPKTSWFVPSDITVEWLRNLNESSPRRVGHMFSYDASDSSSTAKFSYIHLTHTSDEKDQVFFCDSGQDQLATVPWIFMRSNSYLVPGYFFVSKFNSDLGELFPDKEAIFHLLGRYLLHPSDAVWAWITRFYKAYLADYDQQVGLQIRTFNDKPLPYFSQQIQQCVRHHNLLPKIVTNLDSTRTQYFDLRAPKKRISVLMTALQLHYYESLRDYYMSGPTEGDKSVTIHQPSHEGWQQTDNLGHNLKAWAEIYLLSLSDTLITSGWSTFGYSAQALAGIKPWILLRSVDGQTPNPPCVRARSIEPCFHVPPTLKCYGERGANPAKFFPYVQACEDVSWGIKIITEPPQMMKNL